MLPTLIDLRNCFLNLLCSYFNGVRPSFIYLPIAMEDSCKIYVKKECVSSSSVSQYGSPLNSMCPVDIQRERRYIRAEIIRCKRAGVACDDAVLTKKRRLDEVSSVSVVSDPCCSTSTVELDSNKIRQLRNRESAERSRLKKDLLVESLTYQVLQCVLQIADLRDEQCWLKNQQMFGSGCTSSPYSTVDDSTSVSSAITTCDEAESDSDDCDDSKSAYSSVTPSATMCVVNSSKLHYNSSPSDTSCQYSGSSSTSTVSYFSDDELLDDCADLIDTWMLEGM